MYVYKVHTKRRHSAKLINMLLYCSSVIATSDVSGLRLVSLKLGDAGNYSCTAQNELGHDTINYALKVKCKGIIFLSGRLFK